MELLKKKDQIKGNVFLNFTVVLFQQKRNELLNVNRAQLIQKHSIRMFENFNSSNAVQFWSPSRRPSKFTFKDNPDIDSIN